LTRSPYPLKRESKQARQSVALSVKGDTLGSRAQLASANRLGVTHGALARACHAAYDMGSLGRAWKPLR